MSSDLGWCDARPDTSARANVKAIELNPANGEHLTANVIHHDDGTRSVIQPLTGIADKFWRNSSTLEVAFTNGNDTQRQRVMDAASRWSRHANLRFVEVANARPEAPDIRISFDQGQNWSKVGTDSRLETEDGNASMVFFNFTPGVGTILHEFGHAIGLKHEHQNPDAGIDWNKTQVYSDLAQPPNNWTKSRVDGNVFAVIEDDSLNYSRFDPDSVMGYNIPATWTNDGFSTSPGGDLSAFDISGIGDWYPFGGAQQPSSRSGYTGLRVVTRGVTGRMFEKQWDGSRWRPKNDWELALEGRFTGHPSVTPWHPGLRLVAVARGLSGEPVSAEMRGSRWTPWTGMSGGITGSPLVLGAGLDEWCFVRGSSGRPFYKRREIHGTWDTSSGGWIHLGDEITGGIAGDGRANRLAIAVRLADGEAAIKWWTRTAGSPDRPNPERWWPDERTWVRLGAQITARPAIMWLGDTLHVLARFEDGTPHSLIYDTNSNRITNGWRSRGGAIIGSPTLVSDVDAMHAFVRGTSGRAFHQVWRDGAWSGPWESLGGNVLDSPTATRTSDGRIHVFVTGSSRRGFHKVFDGTRWSPAQLDWGSMGGNLEWGI